MIEVKTAEILPKILPIQQNKSKNILSPILKLFQCSSLSLCSSEKIKNDASLKHQGIADMKKIQIQRNRTLIDTNTYILIFNNSILPKEIRIVYIITKVEPYIPNLCRRHNCQIWPCTKTMYENSNMLQMQGLGNNLWQNTFVPKLQSKSHCRF